MTSPMNTDTILSVGLVVIDVMTEMENFPIEDTKCRSGRIYERVGGNAANNCVVLSILGEKSSFMGCVGTTPHHLQLVKDTFHKYSVDFSPMIECEHHIVPLSICIICQGTGSRTCLHYRGSLPELSFDMFTKSDLQLATYKWIHFEGRYEYRDTKKMIQYLRDLKTANKGFMFKISVEIEKAAQELERLFDAGVDYLFISKDFSLLMGYTNMIDAAKGLSERVGEGVSVICPWGAEGAAAQTKHGHVVSSPAFAPAEILNSLGAGDTFVAACIKALSNNNDLSTSIRFACKVAGAKCGVREIDQLRDMDFSS